MRPHCGSPRHQLPGDVIARGAGFSTGRRDFLSASSLPGPSFGIVAPAACKRVRRVGVVLLKRPDYPVNGGVAEGWGGIAAAGEGLRRDRARWEAKQRPNRFRCAAGVYQPAK